MTNRRRIRAIAKSLLTLAVVAMIFAPAPAHAQCVGRTVEDDKGNAAGAGACVGASTSGVSISQGATVDSSTAATRVEYFVFFDVTTGLKPNLVFCYGIDWSVNCPIATCVTC